MQYITIFNNAITVISLFVNLTFVIPLILKIYTYFTDKKYVKRVLGFNRDSVKVSHGVFHLTTDIGIANSFITYASLDSVDNIIRLLNIVGQEFDLMGKGMYSKNEINIGGFMVNKKVNAYFSKHFLNFKYQTDMKYKSAYESYPIDTRIVGYSCDKFGLIINNKIFLEIKYGYTDYAFLIKMVNSDFKDDDAKTVHIMFGASDKATYKATEYLLTHYKQIYKKFGNDHYFFAIEINLVDESINYSQGIIDFTDEMFS